MASASPPTISTVTPGILRNGARGRSGAGFDSSDDAGVRGEAAPRMGKAENVSWQTDVSTVAGSVAGSRQRPRT